MRFASAALSLLLAMLCPATAGPITVIGDSLTKEYEVTFPGLPSVGLDGLDPDHPAARNWIEILHAARNAHFDTGRFRNFPILDMWPDIRLLGHEYNWAVPGATARHIRDLLTNSDLEEITGDEDIALLLSFAPEWNQSVTRLTAQLQTQSAGAVIFCGGNDLRFGNSDPAATSGGTPVSYETIYAGDGTGAGDPQPLMDSIRASIQAAVTFVRTANPGLPVAVCAVPHVGAAPDVNAKWPFDPVRTGRITAALDALNAGLKEWVESNGAVWVSTPYDLTKDLLGRTTWSLGGQTFQVAADPLGADATPGEHNVYLFAQDGFHPTTLLQALMAQAIHAALRGAYPAVYGDSPEFTLADVFAAAGLPEPADDDLFAAFLAAAGVPEGARGPLDDPDGDGIPNVLEFALDGFHPASPDAGHLPEAVPAQGAMVLTWRPRDGADAYPAVCEVSADLQSWAPVPESQMADAPDGTRSATIPVAPGEPAFLRLRVAVEQ